MEQWEKRYLHAKAVRDAYYYMNGEEPPSGEQYGQLTFPSTYMLLRYNGDLFWEFMKKEGHDFCEFERCCCKRKAVNNDKL